MIHNTYMEPSNIPGQDTEPLQCAPCPAGCHVSLCSSGAGGVCSGQRVQRSLIPPGLEGWNAAGLSLPPIQVPEPRAL